ncbi:MAG: putative sulfate/molybdate transporter [Promethearchaeota archaeon]
MEINNKKIYFLKLREKFTLRELSGSLGDWGTLIPFIMGYVSIVGFNPAGIFLCLGMTNIILGLKHDLPLPVQPQKTIATVAISRQWSVNMVISTGLGTGIIWTILGFSKKMNSIVKKVPEIAVRGIQFGLALILGWAALLLMVENYLLAVFSMVLMLLLLKNQKIPSAIILVGLGIFIIFFTRAMTVESISFNLPQFTLYVPTWKNLLIGMIIAGIAQLFLTLTNVMIATVALINDLYPERQKTFDADILSFNMGAINIISPFLGGIPLCHGSGGLAAQYAFGARTGGSMIMEGLFELILGLFFSETLFLLFTTFPKAILGAMLLYTAFLLGRISQQEFRWKKFFLIAISGVFCFLVGLVVGFLIGLVLSFLFKERAKKEDLTRNKE